MDERCVHLPWDSAFFGFPIARIVPGRADSNELRQILEWCKRQHIACIYWLIDPDAYDTCLLAEDQGFRLTDVRITLKQSLSSNALQRGPAARTFPKVREAAEADLSALEAIAAESHTDTRFFADMRFDRPACRRLYETWIRNSLHGLADKVFVVEQELATAGYVTCKLDGQCGRIDLLAVRSEHRGRGVGRMLVDYALNWMTGLEIPHAEVITSIRNIAAQRLYQQSGFLASASGLWLHRWLQP